MSEMSGWEPLPDEVDPRWEDDGDDVWSAAERLVAAADASGANGWRDVAIRVFEFAADWDVHELLRNLRHGPEQAFAGDEQAFATRLEPLSEHPRAGTRLWVARELGILRQLSSLPYLVARVDDDHPAVAAEARSSISMLGQSHPAARVVAERLQGRGSM